MEQACRFVIWTILSALLATFLVRANQRARDQRAVYTPDI
jgi:hypothetical protein